jgi:hypothetical protein
MKSSAANTHFPHLCPCYTMATLSTPEQELSKNLLKPEPGRYLIRRRTKRSNTEDVIAAQLIKDLCAREHLEVEKVTHIGTSITEEYLHIVFDYGDPGHTVATINAYKGKQMKRIVIPAGMTTYINRRVDNWIRLHKIQGIGFPIRDEVLQSSMLDATYSQYDRYFPPDLPILARRKTSSARPGVRFLPDLLRPKRMPRLELMNIHNLIRARCVPWNV